MDRQGDEVMAGTVKDKERRRDWGRLYERRLSHYPPFNSLSAG